ncbi:M14 family zinc carboxypeptidase [Marinicella litoralis]|uniref:Carboxypeptidase family protein n=1 Tax=Marinicella litoralis TaxID=644220 RepID=A0A4R6XQC2_9GAMM|nr:M14 family zinc carboxypeptidase [Marinicella litoralis]TDR18448.1 carboxypeptidase family protein [Marinicella litoralis]
MKFIYLAILLLFIAPSLQGREVTFQKGEGPWIVLAHYQNKQEVLDLKPYFDFWKIDEKNKTVLMLVDDWSEYQALLNQGFTLEMHQKLMEQQFQLKSKSTQGIKTIDNFPCYRTVSETYAAMSDMNVNFPDLVSLVDIGDSWHKTEPGGLAGYDMQVVKITNEMNAVMNKPILYAMGSIHSREYPPAELVTRFAEHLLSAYGVDADVTWLLDYHEIHLLLQGNPDGRVISETQSSPNQRKNRNENHCFAGNQQGVDMNRNFGFKWSDGVCSGGCSSGNSCSTVFRGSFAVSEPETIAINNYIQTLFPDEREDDINDPAPLNKPGVYLDIHNVAELTLFPWGYSDDLPQAPNHDQLQTLARKMSFYTGYRPEQSNSSLGGADGASDDNAYGTLGVAAFTIELGEGGFYSSCNAFDNTIWPDNLPALIYAAKASRMPYVLASGPDVIDLPQSAIQIPIGQTIELSGTATDLRFNNGAASTGNEPTQNITAVKAYITTPSWQTGAIAIDMTATDGSFNNTEEGFTGSIDSSGLSEGRHTVWFEATDASGITGVPYAIFVDAIDPANIGTLSGVVRDASDSTLIAGANLIFDGMATTSDNSGVYNFETTATNGDLTINKLGYVTQTVASVGVFAGKTTTQNIYLEPSCEIQVLNNDIETFNQISDGGWSLITGDGPNDWRIDSGDDHTLGNGKAYVSTDVSEVTDKSLVSPQLLLADSSELTFWHKHQFEGGNSFYDGGVVEIKVVGSSVWQDLGGAMIQNGYNGTLSGGSSQPLGAVSAFVGSLGTFTEVKVDLSAYNNQSVNVRWRMGTDSSVSAGDWKIDDIRIAAAGECPNPNDIIFIDGFEA